MKCRFIKRKMQVMKLLSIAVTVCFCLNLHASPKFIRDSRVLNDSTIRRQYFAMKFNFVPGFLIHGMECTANGAIKNYLHVVGGISFYTYGAAIENPKVTPRYGYAATCELRLHKPVKNTFTGFFAGPFYAYRAGYYKYKTSDLSVNGEYYWRGHALGLVAGVAVCPKRHPHFLFEIYLGYGRMLNNYIYRRVRGELYPPTTLTDDIRNSTANYFRIGSSIGFAF